MESTEWLKRVPIDPTSHSIVDIFRWLHHQFVQAMAYCSLLILETITQTNDCDLIWTNTIFILRFHAVAYMFIWECKYIICECM